jgi:hypothetical protein
MNIKWFNKVSNVKVLQKAKMQTIDTLLALSQLRKVRTPGAHV